MPDSPAPVSSPFGLARGYVAALGAVSLMLWGLPGQLDLKFGAVVFDLEFHFQVDLLGDVRDKP